MRARLAWWTWLAILALAGAFVAVLIGDHLLYSQRAFDGERWRAGSTRQRARMVRDLKWSGVLIGKTRDEVVALLGPSDPNMGQGMYEFVNGGLISNALDFWVWREWLWVRFDRETGRVCEVTYFD